MFSKLDIYIARTLISKILFITSAFFILIFLIDLLENSRKLSDSFKFYNLLLFSTLHAFEIIAQILFFITFLGCLFTFLQFAKTSELQVMKISGVSNLRIAKPFLIIILGLSLLPSILFSQISDYTSSKQLQTTNSFGATGLWLKEQSQHNYFLINFKGFDVGRKLLQNVSIVCFNCSGFEDNTLITAKAAKIAQGQLTIYNVTAHEANKLPNKLDQMSLPLSFSQEFLLSYIMNHNKQKFSFFKLFDQIKTSKANGINTLFYRIELHNYLTNPLLFLAIFMLAMRLGSIKPREGDALKMILIGIAINFVIYFILAITQNLIHLKLGNIFTFIYLPKLILTLLFSRQLLLHLQ
ncbi:MAG: LptF/LptG family permease [Rickettsiales bacterium]|nr:LptF/LptG family permease [Rickettsiales bacterium]